MKQQGHLPKPQLALLLTAMHQPKLALLMMKQQLDRKQLCRHCHHSAVLRVLNNDWPSQG